MAEQKRLLEQLHNEPFALCFSGQGFDWISSLRETLAEGARDRANEVAAAADRILKPVARQLEATRPQGFEPVKWAENGADGIDLVRAAVSVPGIFLSQIANLHTLEARGLDSGKAAGVIGHSQGHTRALSDTRAAACSRTAGLGRIDWRGGHAARARNGHVSARRPASDGDGAGREPRAACRRD